MHVYTPTQIATGHATGKVILMGEHAVVHQQPAIALPFPAVQVTTTIRPSRHPLSIACDFYSGVAYQMPEVLNSLKYAIHQSLQHIQELNPSVAIAATTRSYWDSTKETVGAASFVNCPHIEMTIESTIPAERGMGSSAAVAVSVVRALFHYYQQPLSNERLWTLVQEAETIAHGNPSGIDTATTSGSAPVYYQKGLPIEPIALNSDAVLVVADTGMTGHTLEAVRRVQQLLHTNQIITPSGQTASDVIQAIGQLVQEARIAIEGNQPRQLGALMTQNHTLLQALEVSNEALDTLVDTALTHGALGAKVTGGGRGGCMIALAKTLDDATHISQELAKNGAQQTWYHALGTTDH